MSWTRLILDDTALAGGRSIPTLAEFRNAPESSTGGTLDESNHDSVEYGQDEDDAEAGTEWEDSSVGW